MLIILVHAGRVGGVATSLSFDAAADSPGAGAGAGAGAGDALPPIDHKSKAMAAYLQDGRTPDPSEVRATFFSTRISLGPGACSLLCHILSCRRSRKRGLIVLRVVVILRTGGECCGEGGEG